MFIRMCIVCGLALLSACAPRVVLHGIPDIADGSESRWVYFCDDGANGHYIVVEYANRGGRYSATLALEAGEQVLDVVKRQGGVLAQLPPLSWSSESGALFTLRNGRDVVLKQCRALRKETRGNIELKFGGLLGDE